MQIAMNETNRGLIRKGDHMKLRQVIFVLLIVIFSVIVASCSGDDGAVSNAVAEGVAATQTKRAWEAELESMRLTEAATEPSVTPEPAIVHITYPSFVEGSNTFVTDFSSLDYAPEKSTVGDYYQMNRMERPFTTEDMDYLGDLDITRVDLKYSPPWFYATFFLAGDLRESGNVKYGLEFDIDSDGRGDFLVWAALPPGPDWTTDGVSVLEDRDNDIGGLYPLQMEDPNPAINGYEMEIFNAGLGDDPDLAWIRRDPEVNNQIQIAFKESFTGSEGFLWSAWADEGLINPGMFDYNDQISFTDAGSPNDESPDYPLKAVEKVDSTCRSWYGMTPVGDEPGLCTIKEEKPPEDNQPRMGFCPAKSNLTVGPTQLICDGPCTPECPPHRVCIPCTLP